MYNEPLRKERIVSTLREPDVVIIEVSNSKTNVYNNIKVLVIPIICSPLSNQFIDIAKQRYSHLNRIELADANNHNDMFIDLK